MLDPIWLGYIFAVFILGGMLKGIAGFGTPLITVPLISLFDTVPLAVALSLLPIVFSNISQGYEYRRHHRVLRVIWPLLLSLSVSLAVAVQLLGKFHTDILAVCVGIMIQIFVITQLTPTPPIIPPQWRSSTLVGSGLSSGLLGGLTSFYGFPALQALMALGLGRNDFIFATSLLFLVGTTIVGIGLLMLNIITPIHLLLSLACVVPTQLGMYLGGHISKHLSLAMFHRITLAMLSATSLVMIIRALMA